MEKRCGHCGTINKNNAKYCHVCGAQIEESDHIDLPSNSVPNLYLGNDNPSVVYDDHITIGNKSQKHEQNKKANKALIIFIIIFSVFLVIMMIPIEEEYTDDEQSIIEEEEVIIEQESYDFAQEFCESFYESKDFNNAKAKIMQEYLEFENLIDSINNQIEATKNYKMSCQFIEQSKLETYDIRQIENNYKSEIGKVIKIEDGYRIIYDVNYVEENLNAETLKILVIKVNEKWYIW